MLIPFGRMRRAAHDRYSVKTRLGSALFTAGFALFAVGFLKSSLAADAKPVSLAASEGNASKAAGPASASLEEITVTAQKRVERLQDVPVPVSAVNAEKLLQNSQTQIADYFSQIPGVSFASNVRGAPVIAIRGLVTGTDQINPTVGIVVDDVPFGASTALGGGDSTPDIDPSDLQRVEVLRGPQGTLYGASSLGGLVKFVTVEPSTDHLFGNVQAGVNSIYNGDGPGYNVRGSVNVPLSDTLAVLASAFTHDDPGYIDNPSHGLRGVNEVRASGARISTLWRPSDDLSVRLSALYQHTTAHGANHVEIEPGVGDLQQNDVPQTGLIEKKLQAYSATINATLGSAKLTSVTGYIVNHVHDLVDYSVGFSFLSDYTQVGLGIPDGTTGSTMDDNNQTSRFSQELRVSMPLGDKAEWLVGGFFTHERSPYVQTFFASDPATGAYLGQWATLGWVATYREFAGFTDLTYHFTNRFDVQIGAREATIEQSYRETDSGPLVPIFESHPSPLYFDQVVTKSSAFTYLLTPRFKITPDLMVYARLASGYRPGGPNQTASAFNLPLEYKPDRTQNYELGIKGDVANHRFSYDASLYYIDWTNIQLSFIDPTSGFGFNSNGKRAKSQGIELSTEARPFPGFSISAWVAYNQAVLTEAFPPSSALSGEAGDRLPFGARFSGSVSMDDEFPITGNVQGFAGASASYVGDRVGNFTSAPPRQEYPAYARVDLHGGVKLNPWTVSLYVKNVMDRRGILYGGLGTLPNPAAFEYIQPRTVGVNVLRSF